MEIFLLNAGWYKGTPASSYSGNYFAWIGQSPANELRLWVDVPDALIGDCYYLQNLVTAIEAWGQAAWR